MCVFRFFWNRDKIFLIGSEWNRRKHAINCQFYHSHFTNDNAIKCCLLNKRQIKNKVAQMRLSIRYFWEIFLPNSAMWIALILTVSRKFQWNYKEFFLRRHSLWLTRNFIFYHLSHKILSKPSETGSNWIFFFTYCFTYAKIPIVNSCRLDHDDRDLNPRP